jgi:hypothetical protein
MLTISDFLGANQVELEQTARTIELDMTMCFCSREKAEIEEVNQSISWSTT